MTEDIKVLNEKIEAINQSHEALRKGFAELVGKVHTESVDNMNKFTKLEELNTNLTNLENAHEALKKGFADLIGKVYTESVANMTDIKIIPANGVLANNREFRLIHLGKIPSFTLALPNEIPDVFKGKIIFRSANNGCALNIPGLTFIGDDCVDGKFVSTESKYYEITYENLGPRTSASNADQSPIILAKVTAFKL